VLVGYVSDEYDVALSGVELEFEGEAGSVAARARATGAVYADVSPGPYQVALTKPGYGSKRVSLAVDENRPYRFRLLSDCLLGYMWPKWSRAGESAEFRVHAPEAFQLDLWRYGWKKELIRSLGWWDEHDRFFDS